MTISRDDVLKALELLLKAETQILDEVDKYISKNWKRNGNFSKAGKIIDTLRVVNVSPAYNPEFNPIEHQRKMRDKT